MHHRPVSAHHGGTQLTTPRKKWLQIWYIARMDLRARYVETRLGFAWAIIQPTVTFVVFWAVTTFGLKLDVGTTGAPHYAILFCGLLPWITLSTAVGGSSGVLRGYKHLLLDRVISPPALIVANTLSAGLMHIPLFLIVVAIFAGTGMAITPAWGMSLYYIVCLMALTLGVSMVAAPLAARSKDTVEIVTTFLQLWFWSSPVIWTLGIMSDTAQFYMRFNPFVYIIEGYRGTLLLDTSLPSPMLFTLVYWAQIVGLIALGLWLFRRSGSRLNEWLRR